MIKYIAYCRKSTDEPDRQILSIEAQVAELEEHAAKEGLKIVSFITESKTAKEPGREKFAQVLEMIESGEAAGIISCILIVWLAILLTAERLSIY